MSDGQSSVYLMPWQVSEPWEFNAADEQTLRWMLARRRSAAS
jgi:hypothetical protein